MEALWIWTAVFAVVAYLVCGIPFGLIIANREGGVDVRQVGSGNIGTTNVARSVGKKAAGLTLLLDAVKGLVCVLVARWGIATFALGGDMASLDWHTLFGTSLSVIFLACLVGHIFSPYLHFHGGKGIAVGLGAGLGLCWPATLAALAVFAALAVPTKHVSLGSVAAAVTIPIGCAVAGFPAVSLVPVVAGCLIVIWAHRENIRKLLHGEESSFKFHEAGDDPAGAPASGEKDGEPR